MDTSILSFQKQEQKQSYEFSFKSIKEKPEISQDIHNTPSISININTLNKQSFTFSDPMALSIRQKIEKIGIPLKDWDISINIGVVTGYNEAFIIDTAKRDEILSNCQNEDERDRTEELIKPILRGRDIKRYSYEWAGLYCISTFPALNLNIDDYPALKAYLESFGRRLHPIGETGTRKKTTNKWFETQDNIAYWRNFAKQKIVYSEIVREPQFYLDNGEFKFGNFYAESTSFILTGENLKYLLGILNSKITGAIYKNFYAGGG